MTNHWNDIQHADCVLVIGGNPAENHPLGFSWVLKAREKRGAKIISVDPRYTRTSQQADIYAQLRSGTDIPFIGGLINYIIENNLYQKDYIVTHTNAPFIVDDAYSFKDGLFNSYDEKSRSYDTKSWKFKKDAQDQYITDPSLQNPRCVFQLMKKHFSRYDIDTVVGVTGTDKNVYKQIAKTYAETGKSDKTGTIMYAMGTTQHTVGTQNVRSYAILQMLLGNIGMPGGGVNAMRGESNVQGSTDFALLYDNVNGYLDVPRATKEESTYKGFLEKITPKAGYYTNKPKFYTSMLKAYYGDNATAGNEFGYQYLPKLTPRKDYSHMRTFDAMYEGKIEGAFMFGQNPVVGGPNAGQEQNVLSNLKWLVAIDLWETETSSFWQKEAGADPASIQTEVFLLPACGSYEKEGSITNSGRWIQYRWQAIKPKGDSRADLEIIHQLALRLKELYKNSSNPADEPMKAINWNFGEGDHPDIDLVSREINGYDMTTKKQIKGFGDLKDDGTTCSGIWIYCGYYPEEGNLSKSRDNTNEGMSNFQNWSYAWPANRRVLYNRVSSDVNGKPWSQDKVVIYWDELNGEWTGYDVPDFVKTKAPKDAGGSDSFIMMETGKGGIFAVRNEGPFPEHYEPYDSPIPNAFSSIQFNPAVKFGLEAMNKKGEVSKFPIIATTYRLTEHWQSGAMTRNQEWLSQLMPHMFIEISEELANEKGIKNAERVIVSSARGEIDAFAMVTKRFKPYKLNGKTVHHVGMPWHFGYKGIVTGGTANRLTPHIGDANTTMPEYKAFLIDIRRA